MFKRLAKKIAQKHMELRSPQQPLRLQPDYGERNAADFLGENVVQVNMGIEPLKGGPGNVKDEVIADDFEAEFEAEELEGFEIVDDMGLDRMAKDHEESGSYMSRQNLREMSDMADFIVDDIGMEGLDDWVEDKISQSYSNLNDVARYRGYRDDHPHGEESFKFADDLDDEIIDDLDDEIIDDLDDEIIDDIDDEIIDDMGIMADFDKESRVKSHKHHSPKDVKDSYEEQKKNFGKDWEKYEGAMGPKGLDPARVKKNEGGGSKGKPSGMTALDRLAHYDIIDDLEW